MLHFTTPRFSVTVSLRTGERTKRIVVRRKARPNPPTSERLASNARLGFPSSFRALKCAVLRWDTNVPSCNGSGWQLAPPAATSTHPSIDETLANNLVMATLYVRKGYPLSSRTVSGWLPCSLAGTGNYHRPMRAMKTDGRTGQITIGQITFGESLVGRWLTVAHPHFRSVP